MKHDLPPKGKAHSERPTSKRKAHAHTATDFSYHHTQRGKTPLPIQDPQTEETKKAFHSGVLRPFSFHFFLSAAQGCSVRNRFQAT